MKKYFFLLLLSGAFFYKGFSQEITEEYGYRSSKVGQEFGELESTSDPDEGGYLTFFVRNNTQEVIYVQNVLANNGTLNSEGFQVWPKAILPGKVSWIILKSLEEGMGSGNSVNVSVSFSNNVTISRDFLCNDSHIRIANVIPSQNNDTLFIYFRMDAGSSATLTTLYLNEQVYTVNQSAFTILGGNPILNQGKIAIGILPLVQPMPELHPLAIRVSYQLLDENNTFFDGAGIRLMKAEFPLGTWNSSAFNPDNENGRKRLRRYALNSVFGPSNSGNMQSSFNEYHMRTVWEPNFGNDELPDSTLGRNTVINHANDPYVHLWSLDDEPDLNGKPVQSGVIKNETYWNHDTNTPSYVNLAVQKKYNRWSWLSDVVSMDHYCDDGAPNVIPNSWIPFIGREGSMKEAYEYSRELQYNCEPRRMYSWSQLAAGVWNTNPEPYIINTQFWRHIAAGAKGIHWFVAQTGTEEDYPEQWNEGIRLTQQLNPIKNLCLRAENGNYIENMQGSISANTLVSPEALLLIVVNDEIDFEFASASPLSWASSMNQTYFEVTVQLPDWVMAEQVYMADEHGKQIVANLDSLGQGKYKVSGMIHYQSLVFVFGKNDKEPPYAPTGLNIPDILTDNSFTLSWKEPYDNMGIFSYNVFINDELVSTVKEPIANIQLANSTICNQPIIKVQALDASGNTSTFSEIVPTFLPQGVPMIDSFITCDFGLNPQFDTMLQVFVTPSSFTTFEWQISNTNGQSWTSIQNDELFNGQYTSSLEIDFEGNLPQGGDYLIRVIVKELCGEGDTVAIGSFSSSVSINELSSRNQLILFPNPSRDIVYVKGLVIDGAPLEIFNTEGRVIWSQMVLSSHYSLPVHDWSSGLYLLKQGNRIKSFVVQP